MQADPVFGRAGEGLVGLAEVRPGGEGADGALRGQRGTAFRETDAPVSPDRDLFPAAFIEEEFFALASVREGLEQQGLVGLELQPDLRRAVFRLPHRALAEASVHRVVDADALADGVDRDPAGDGFLGRILDEVVMASVVQGPADALQAQVVHLLAGDAGALQQGVQVGGDADASAPHFRDAQAVLLLEMQPGLQPLQARTILFQVGQARHVGGQFVLYQDGGALARQVEQFLEGGQVHLAALRDDQRLVAAAAQGDELAALCVDVLPYHPVRDVVPGVTAVVEGFGGLADGALRGRILVHVIKERFPAALGQQVRGVEEEQDVAVRMPGLQEALAARHVGVEGAKVLPEGVGGLEMHGGVEQPARPGGVVGGEAGAVVEDVVHPREEVGVHRGLDVAQGGDEVLVQPGGGLRGGQGLVGHVRGGRGGLHPDDAPAFGLRDVAHAIQVHDVGGGAVGLVAYALALRGGPLLPQHGVLLAQEFADGLAVVEHHAVLHFLLAGKSQKFGHVRLEVVAPAGPEFFEEGRGPVAVPAGVVHLVGVVEIVAYLADVVALEGLVELLQVAGDGLAREVVDHVALAAGTSPLDQFAVPAQEQGAQGPVAFRRRPVKGAVLPDACGQVLVRAAGTVGRDGDQREFQRVAHLLVGVLLEIVIGGDGIAHRGNVVRDTDGADHRRLGVAELVFQPLSALQAEGLVREVAAGIFRLHPGAAEGPAGGVREIDAEVAAVRLLQGIGEEVHPGGRQIV